VANRKLRDPLDRACDEWVEFQATVTSRPIIGGLGNVDEFSAPAFPDNEGYEGLALRLFEPETGLWRIWWAANVRPGGLDTPLVGRFEGEVGTFECDDTIGSQQLRIRFEWLKAADDTGLPRWRQWFRFAGESEWRPNWQMDLSPAD
jgi:hypothetical protein